MIAGRRHPLRTPVGGIVPIAGDGTCPSEICGHGQQGVGTNHRTKGIAYEYRIISGISKLCSVDGKMVALGAITGSDYRTLYGRLTNFGTVAAAWTGGFAILGPVWNYGLWDIQGD